LDLIIPNKCPKIIQEKKMKILLILFGLTLFSGPLLARSCKQLLTKEYFKISAKLARAMKKNDPFSIIYLRKRSDSLKDTKDLISELDIRDDGEILQEILLGLNTKKISRPKAKRIIFDIHKINCFCFPGKRLSWMSLSDLSEGLEEGYLEEALKKGRR
jgi:hypothetical protein